MVMKVTIDSRPAADVPADLLAVALTTLPKKTPKLPTHLVALDRATGGQLKRVIASGDFLGGARESLLLYPTSKGCKAKRVALLGLGDADAVDADGLRRLAGRAIGEGAGRKAGRVVLVAPELDLAREPEGAQAMAEGATLSAYRFEGYRGKDNTPSSVPSSFTALVPRGTLMKSVRAAASRGNILAESQNLARDLSNEPANALPPAALARAAQKLGRETGLKVKVLDEVQLKKRKMGAILAVGGGSVNPPRLIVIEHRPPGKRPKGEKPFCIVGKGITFDSGGISIKPSAGMDEMKHDMSGAATVVGAMRAVALLKVPYPVIGVIGAAENMPSGTAYRPGDVVTAMSGKTIEVLNTDAEGRVVLADALHYTKTEYDPCAMVDLATLTGACLVALGGFATGLFANHDKLSEQLRSAGEATAELAWPMPLLQGHKDEIRSQIGDIKNTGGRAAGASTAAAFLWNFAEETPWAHLDIAGTGWTTKSNAYQGRGATGVGVRLLLELLRDFDPKSLD
jgi:leucyl aminopeptidase